MLNFFKRRIGEVHKRENIIEWKIPNFFRISENELFSSPSFWFDKVSWCLNISPNNANICNSEPEGDTGISLIREFSGPSICLEYSLGLKTVHGIMNEVKKFKFAFGRFISSGTPLFLNRYVLFVRMSELVPSGVLTVVCVLKYCADFTVTGGGNDSGLFGSSPGSTETIKCSYCDTILSTREEISSHHQKCTEFHKKCPKCGKLVTTKNWCDHKYAITEAGGFGKAVTTKCSYCQLILDEHEDFSSHLQVCTEFPADCPVSEVDDKLRKGSLESQITGAEGRDAAETTECFFCKILLDASGDVSCHLRKCPEFPVGCPMCGEDVPLKNWYCHKCLRMTEATVKLLNDLKSMMLRGEHSDVMIKMKGEEFRLHRNVLASRSPYFHSMFNCSMKEKNTGIVTVDDCEPDVFRSFIHFLYTGKVDKLTFENVSDLYELADKYQEDQLKSECLHFMIDTLSVHNFCDFTVLAFRHDEKELLENSVKFFASNTKEIIRSVKWQNLLTEYPIQANELHIKALD